MPTRFSQSIAALSLGAFTMPWPAVQRWRKTDRVLAEEVCAENNFSYFNFEVAPIPQAAKPDF